MWILYSRILQNFCCFTVKHSKGGVQTSSHPQNSASHLLGLQGLHQTPAPFFGYLRQSEKLSENKLPLDSNCAKKYIAFHEKKSWKFSVVSKLVSGYRKQDPNSNWSRRGINKIYQSIHDIQNWFHRWLANFLDL